MDGARETTLDRLAGRLGPRVVRWLLGLLWLANVDWKVPNDFGGAPPGCGGFCGRVQAGVDHPVLPGSAWALEHLVAPNLAFFGWLALITEVTVAVLLLTGRVVRVAALLSMAASVAIFLSAANSPAEWYWSSVLMFGLSLAVLVLAPEDRPEPPRHVAAMAAAYGVIVILAHASAGWSGDGNASWSQFAGGRSVPDALGRALFPGSIGLGLLIIGLAAVAWFLAGTGTAVRRTAGWVIVGAATVLLLSYRAEGLVIALGSRATSAAVIAMVGVSLIPPRAT